MRLCLTIPKDDHMLTRTFPRTMRLAIFVVALLHSSVPSHAQQGPFAGLMGSWAGAGFIKLANGQRERLRCRADYTAGDNGTRLAPSLRCATCDNRYRVHLSIVL